MAKVSANSLYVVPNLFRCHSKPFSMSFRTLFEVILNLFRGHSELVSESLPPKASLLRPAPHPITLVIPILSKFRVGIFSRNQPIKTNRKLIHPLSCGMINGIGNRGRHPDDAYFPHTLCS